MGGTTITIEKDNIIDAIVKLIKEQKDIEKSYHLFLDSITILEKNKKGQYTAFGDKKLELQIGLMYSKIKKDIVIFAHFGK